MSSKKVVHKGAETTGKPDVSFGNFEETIIPPEKKGKRLNELRELL